MKRSIGMSSAVASLGMVAALGGISLRRADDPEDDQVERFLDLEMSPEEVKTLEEYCLVNDTDMSEFIHDIKEPSSLKSDNRHYNGSPIPSGKRIKSDFTFVPFSYQGRSQEDHDRTISKAEAKRERKRLKRIRDGETRGE